MFKEAGCVPKAVKLIKEVNSFSNPKIKESLLGLVSNIIKHGIVKITSPEQIENSYFPF
jgi:pantothenate kinase